MDNPGHSFFRVIGAAAGDAHCYDVFQALFDPILLARQSLHRKGALHHVQCNKPEDTVVELWNGKHGTTCKCVRVCDLVVPMSALAVEELSTRLSTAGESVASVQVSLQRNLLRFRFTPAMSLDDRQKVEKVLCAALAALPEEFAGEYMPLRGSTSTSSRPGMSEAEEAKLQERKWLFEAPDAPSILATGRARHWPQARGVFLSRREDFAAWVNDEDHLRLMAAFASLYAAEKDLAQSLSQSLGHSFARSDRLGFLTTCPSNLGTAFRAKVRVTLPLLGRNEGFSDLARALGVQAKRVVRPTFDGNWDISNAVQLNISEVEQANSLIAAVRKMHDLELQLKSGQVLDLATEAENFRLSMLKAPEDTSGLGAAEESLSCHIFILVTVCFVERFNSIVADLLKRDPELYSRLRTLKTSKGVSLARCIKPGMDNKARNAIRSSGLVAGDAESYSVFAPMFVPALAVDGYSHPRHPEALDPACVSRPIAAYGGHVIGARVEASRNLVNFCFPSAMALDERADLERIVTKVLLDWDGELSSGLPERGSDAFLALSALLRTWRAITSLSAALGHLWPMMVDAADLESHGLLFQAPSSAMFLSSGMGKHWPQAHGVYVNSSKDMAIWINEEDHLRLIATASSPQKAFDRFCALEGALKLGLQHEGLNFASHEAFGFLTSCPSRVGTGGFQVGVKLKLALVEDAEDRHFEDVSCEIESQGILQMKATAKIGQSEADVVQAVVSACEQLVAEEIQLATGAARSSVVENFSAKLNSIRQASTFAWSRCQRRSRAPGRKVSQQGEGLRDSECQTTKWEGVCGRCEKTSRDLEEVLDALRAEQKRCGDLQIEAQETRCQLVAARERLIELGREARVQKAQNDVQVGRLERALKERNGIEAERRRAESKLKVLARQATMTNPNPEECRASPRSPNSQMREKLAKARSRIERLAEAKDAEPETEPKLCSEQPREGRAEDSPSSSASNCTASLSPRPDPDNWPVSDSRQSSEACPKGAGPCVPELQLGVLCQDGT
eukprot:s1629_g31.t1